MTLAPPTPSALFFQRWGEQRLDDQLCTESEWGLASASTIAGKSEEPVFVAHGWEYPHDQVNISLKPCSYRIIQVTLHDLYVVYHPYLPFPSLHG